MRAGGAEIVSRAFEFLYDPHTRSDLSGHLAALISAHLGEADVDRRWLDARPAETKLLGKWLRLGNDLGALERVPSSLVLSALGKQITSPVSMRRLVDAGRFDCLLSDDESATKLIDFLLSTPCPITMERVGSPWLYLLPMLLGLGLSGRFYGSHLLDESQFEVGARELSAPGLAFGTALEQQAFEISSSFRDAIRTSELPLTSEPFEDALERCRIAWGDRPAIVAMGATICKMPSRKGHGRLRSVGLFQANKPLCDRLRTAKLRAKNISWWREQAQQAATPMDKFLFQFALWTCARTGIFFELADEVGQMLEEMEETQWGSFIEFAVWASPGFLPLAVPASSSPKLLPRTLSSERLALLMGIRDEGRYARAVFLDHLSHFDDGSTVMGVFRQVQAFDAALAGVLEWETGLSIIRATYGEGITGPLTQVPAAMRMPEAVARQVLSNARDYPVSLWSIAESVANASARKAIRPVGKVSRDDRWFAD